MGSTLLEATGLCKAFGPTQALAEVGLHLHAGEVVAVLGENGAGKSTLIKILSGVYIADAGAMRLLDEPYEPATPADAVQAGVAAVFQEPTFFPQLSVLENVFAGRQPRSRFGNVQWTAMLREGRELFTELGLSPALLDRRMEQLSLGHQQLVLIARALHLEARVLILDEPTSILTENDATKLFALVEQFTGGGGGVLYITHRFGELAQVADRIVVLKDGRKVGEGAASELSEQQVIHLMSGRHIEQAEAMAQGKRGAGDAAPLLTVQGLTVEGAFSDVNLTVSRGEIVGLYGLIGAGRTEIALSLFGQLHPSAGTVTLDGRPYAPRSSRAAMAAGVAYVPEDRKTQGLYPLMDTGANLSTAVLDRVSQGGFVHRSKERTLVRRFVESLGIKTRDPGESILNLSGGSQQKVLLARWLATEPKLLILDEPTRGIDVGTKTEIHRLIFGLAEQGFGVLVISSELPELLVLSDHVHVVRDGRMVADFRRGDATSHAVLEATMGYTGADV
ncbi:MAG: sugar ABC transporter ATP-binding protein [Euzebyaceae bacterium]|jgi:ABC-type sugar transport system ATPase subunit|nr:sugar ABC transporter ATP-binding protein [Euzebyaceae bacterium]